MLIGDDFQNHYTKRRDWRK